MSHYIRMFTISHSLAVCHRPSSSRPFLPPRQGRQRGWVLGLVVLVACLHSLGAATLHLSAPASYLPGLPLLVRVEVRGADGGIDRDLWDAEAILTAAPAGVSLSTNTVQLRNGLGVALLTASGSGDFQLTATANALSASRSLAHLGSPATNVVSGLLGGSSTTWSGLVRVTGDVTVPVGHTLTVQAGSWILLDGVTSGSGGVDLLVQGNLQSLGTAAEPVTFTVSDAVDPARGWGEIRLTGAGPALLRDTVLTRGGRSPGVGHTGSGPVLRLQNASMTLENCSVAYNAGKVMQAESGSSLVISNSVLARSVMGPEISGTALRATDSWFMEMFGPDDNDAIYLHSQQPGQDLLLERCVVAACDDDGVDCLNSAVELEECVVRDVFDKCVSQIAGRLDIRGCLFVNGNIGISIKAQDSNISGTVHVDRTTISTRSRGLAVENKYGVPTVNLEYYVTNSIVWATLTPANSLYTDYDPADIHIFYSDVGEVWPGTGVLNADPLFVDSAGDFHLQAGSPCIDSGDPASPRDPDGSRADMGALPHLVLAVNPLIAFGSEWKFLDNGSDQGSAWTLPGYDDSAWGSGPAQLGYGDGDESTLLGFGPDPNNKYITSYFRREVVVGAPDQFEGLEVRLVKDDGAIVYLNGQELFRSNMPEGPVDYQTWGLLSLENDRTTNRVGTAGLVPGTNLLAVEIHQRGANSSDISFDLELIGLEPNLPPLVSLTQPADNAVFTAPATVSLQATAVDPDGVVSAVAFYQGDVFLGQSSTAPYSWEWSGVAPGIYTLHAVATDNDGATASSAPVTVTVNGNSDSSTNALIALGSVWKYLDDGSDQGTDWVRGDFDDSGWAEGPAQLGYGDGDEATVVSFGPNASAKYVTTYFRRSFTVDDPTLVLSLMLNLLRDDGAVAYLNGQEVWRLNMPDGPPAYDTYAATAGEYNFEATDLAVGVLVPGTNIMAVEVHQGSPSSSDVSFEMELIAVFSAPTNFRPVIAITSPPDEITVAAPADFTVTATASDRDGSVVNVEFFANASKLGEDTTSPYLFNWDNVPAGTYALTAVATDDVGLANTSSVVHVTVSSDTAPPLVQSQSPSPGPLTNLTDVTVTFSKPVTGVDAADFLVNGIPAVAVSGSDAVYTFSFEQPAFGPVVISWAANHGIIDLFTPPHAFDRTGPGATWQYQLNDVFPPLVATLNPPPGSTVASLQSLAVSFTEPVTGVNAADLRVNSQPAATVTGNGAGPYVFGFVQPPPGTVQMAWTDGHGIQDSTGNPFAGGSWSYILDTNLTGVIISEIMYHPASENPLEEYIELFNKGGDPVRLTGWQLRDAVEFIFPEVSIPANGYLVVAADLATFASNYPGLTNIVGNWNGLLSNRGEDIDLDDASGRRIDSVAYADEGDWALRERGPLDRGYRGWVWYREHDGLGKSLELVNQNLSNDSGQNWASSLVEGGTPGRANSVRSNNIPPLILEARHFPVIPASSDSVLITARIVDESISGLVVRLYYRPATATPPPFTAVSLRDDGGSGDLVAGDGLYSCVLPAQPNDTVVEFYIEATDSQGLTRTWPAAARQEDGTLAQTANALFQVDDRVYTGSAALYKLIMTERERQELASIPGISDLSGPNAQMNGTFISLDGAGVEFRYLVGIRNRGHGTRRANPPNYRVNFRSDELWKDVEAQNLNSQQVHLQHVGSVLARKAGAGGGRTVTVQVRVNNVALQTYYAAVEVVDADWAEHHFPVDNEGNVYRVIRDILPPDFRYRGEDQNAYTNTWFKTSNASEDDWADLIDMVRVVGINNPAPFTTENVRRVVNVEQWLRHLAVMNLFGNGESGLNTGYNDDYYMYRGLADRRFILLYWDLDQILGQGGSLGTSSSIFNATANNGAGAALDRFMHWPDFEPIYYRILRELLDTTFSAEQFDATVDQTLDYVTPGTRDAIKSWMAARRTYVESVLPADIIGWPPVAILRGAPRSPTPLTSATVTVAGEGVTHYRYSLDGSAYGAETSVSVPIVLSGMGAGSNVLAVIGRNADGLWQEQTAATVRSWVVNTAWPTVRLNEVLARNDSAVNHDGTFPDLIELYNEGPASVDLSGMRLTDDPALPGKFTFPPGTSLGSGGYLVVYADDPDPVTPEHHTGFALNQEGEGVYLFDTVARGGQLLDSVEFGLQAADLSIGRVVGGDWVLTDPSPQAVNVAHLLGDPSGLRINEWLTLAQSPFAEDFVELYNPAADPMALGGLYLTDQPIGDPARHRIAPLSFIGAHGFKAFLADGNAGAGANHVDFRLSAEKGEIGLFTATLRQIDCVVYGPQQPGVSTGLCPDGSRQQVRLILPTPGVPNACPVAPPPPQIISLVRFDDPWKYENSGADQGAAWREPGFGDSAWPEGPGALGFDQDPVPEPIRTQFTDLAGKMTYYFRKRFVVGANLNLTSVELTHEVDDGAVFYLNGQEIGTRFNLPAGDINYLTAALGNTGAATLQTFSLSPALLPPGENVLAVEVHQSAPTSGDVVFALRLNGLIVTNSPALAGVLINEVLANNQSREEPDGRKPDWVEIYNPSSNAVDLAGMSLTDDLAQPQRWVFPLGSVVPALGYLTARLDADLPASESNAGFGLKTSGGRVYLLNNPADGGAVLSAVTYGIQPADWSIGRVPDGTGPWTINTPSLGSRNLAVGLGDPRQLRINEWMAAPASGDDWFEIYNPGTLPVELSGLFLSDDLNNLQKHQVQALSFIGTGANGFQEFQADDNLLAGADHVNFRLAAGGEALSLAGADGAAIHALTFGPQATGTSEGCLPDGSSNIVRFQTTPTPGRSNFLPLNSLVVNELLSHSDPPLEDAVEFYNASGDDIDIGGWYLSDSLNNLRRYEIDPGTVVPAGGYVVLYEYQFNGDHPGEPFSFSSVRGDEVYLSEAVGGQLTGYRAFAEFGAAENGVSFGRYATSVGFDFVAMNQHTFGVDNPTTTNEFRLGTGAPNSTPRVGPVVISEVHYHPAGTNDHLEFLELHNITASPVPLFDPDNPDNSWRVRKAVRFDFPPSTTLPPDGYLVLVSFDPVADTLLRDDFQANFGTNAVLLGPYEGQLDNAGEEIELLKPDAPQTLPGPDFGVVPYVVVERLVYGDAPPWPLTADGLGDSLQRLSHSSYGNDPVNWTADAPNPGPASGSVQDSDGDGLPDDWELANGLNPNNPADAAADPDGDTLNNLGEYLSGTDPNDPGSYLGIDRIWMVGGDARLEFVAVAGKTYTVQYRNSAAAGPWLRVANVSAQSTTHIVMISNTASSRARFYRVVTPALP